VSKLPARVFARFGLRLMVLVTATDLCAQSPPVVPPPAIPPARFIPIAYADLDGWRADDHAAALAIFRRSCAPGRTAPQLTRVCAGALALQADDRDAARQFFEENFEAYRVVEPGFLTGYFEPEIDGAPEATARFAAPLLARPADLVQPLPTGEAHGLDAALTGARRLGDRLEPYPDRAAIEDGALGSKAAPLVYVDPIDAFVAHVQGSVRVRLADGAVLRLAFAGKNGQPYTSIGRVLSQELNVPAADMTMDKVVAWLRANPAEARRVMRLNRSYIFFRVADELTAQDGPLGAAGVQLTPGRSLAVDTAHWPLGVPFFLETRLPEPDGAEVPTARLVVAQDTGSAIVGVARADLFFGSGAAAGRKAGLVRHPLRLTVLWPKASER
jgi:membrane-bound lytic murein transglycosylase A